MAEVLATAVGFMLVSLILVAALTALTVRSVRRHNRVSPRVRSRAPSHWIVDPTASARLHRRLRAVVRGVHEVVPEVGRRRRQLHDASPLVRMAAEIEDHAVALDHEVVAVWRARGPVRRQRLGELDGQVRLLEQLATRVESAGVAARTRRSGLESTPEALTRLGEELDALEAAHAEIAALEAHLRLASWPPPDPPSR